MSLIVIEGVDGSGKSTQVGMLKEYLQKSGIDFRYMHFPRTEGNAFADLIASFLRGEFGSLDNVNPYLVAMLYAGDRNDAKATLNQWNEEGKLIILDRYVYSNIAYQCAKLSDENEISRLRKWILDTEFGYFSLPRPDLNLFLKVPFSFTRQSLMAHREGSDRNYLCDKADIHETDMEFQRRVREMYLSLEGEENYETLPCSADGETMLPPEEIFSRLLEVLRRKQLI